MSFEENEQLIHQYIEAVWKKKNPEAIYQFLAPDYIRHRSPTQPPLDREGQKQLLQNFQDAFPDSQIIIDEVIVGDGRIAFRSTLEATHRSDFFGIPATGRRIKVSLVDIIHINDNKFVEQWGGPDVLDLVTQLGGKVHAITE